MNRNSEHYIDPTASGAMDTVARTQPIAYGSVPVFVNDSAARQRQKVRGTKIEDMNLEELKVHIRSCAKARTNINNCANCTKDGPGCAFGRRAVVLLRQESNQVPVADTEPAGNVEPKGLEAYKAAIASGDVFMYAFMHAKSPDPQKAKAAAYVRVSSWRKKYGHLVKEPAEPKTRAPRKEKQSDLKEVLTAKINEEVESLGKIDEKFRDLVHEKAKIATRIENLAAERKETLRNISALETAAALLGVKINVRPPREPDDEGTDLSECCRA